MTYNNFDSRISVLACDSEIKGDLHFKYYIRIDGNLKGSIQSEDKVELSKTSIIDGDIESKELILYGKLTGNVKCSKFVIKSGAVFDGSVDSKNFVIEDGAKVNLKAIVH